jgi:hypothetical protein
MKWRPIMFHTSLIPKVMDGTKTQSRRLVNMDQFRVWLPQEVRSDLWDEMPRGERRIAGKGRHLARVGDAGAVWVREWNLGVKPGEFHFCCPLADGETILAQRDSGKKEWTILPAPDQRLWVRETWQAWRPTSVEYDDWEVEIDKELLRQAHIEYRATSESRGPWRSARFMPRWASRTSLEVSLARLQRLQNISEQDAIAEGVQPFFERFPRIGKDQRICTGEFSRDCPYRASFACLWDELNGDRALWSTNPWVWAYTFKKIEVK